MKEPMQETKMGQTAVRFSSVGRLILEKLADRDGVTMKAILERLLREEWRRKKLEPKVEEL